MGAPKELPRTWNPQSPAHEDDVGGFDGPLLLTLLMGNNNNNAALQKANEESRQRPPGQPPPGQPLPGAATLVPEKGWGRLIKTTGFHSPSLAVAFESLDYLPGTASSTSRKRCPQLIQDDHNSRHEQPEKRTGMPSLNSSKSISKEQVSFFHDQGYLVLPRVIDPQAQASVLQESRRLVELAAHGGEGTQDIVVDEPIQDPHPSPVGKIMAAFEPGSKPNFRGDSFEVPVSHVARLGCGLHALHPMYRSLTFNDFVRGTVKRLGLIDPRVTQSLIHAKQRSELDAASQSGICHPHQDGWVSFTDPSTCVTFWCALEDAKNGGGCLEVAPRSHHSTPIRTQLVRGEDGRPFPERLAKPIYPLGVEVPERAIKPEEHDFVPLEVDAGSIVLMHGGLVHRSGRNLLADTRFAYSFSVIDGTQRQYTKNALCPENGEGFAKL